MDVAVSLGEGALGEVRDYDFIFPLGAACSCSQSLRLAGLQFASFPCDWLYGGTPVARAQGLADGFAGWFDRTALVKHDVPWNLEHEPWRNTANGIVFKHDFDWNAPLESLLPGVREKYARRRTRLDKLISAAKAVLIVWLNPPTVPAAETAELAAAREILRTRWPGVVFDVLSLVCARGRSFDDRTDSEADGIRTVSWDYDDGREAFIDNAKMAKFLSSEYVMADYRTEEERRAWPARKRALQYAQYNAKGWWDYALNRAYYRLYRHFRKGAERRGLLRLG